MQELYISLNNILSYVVGEEFTLKTLSQLSGEISALVGSADWSWICYFLSPLNITSLVVYGSFLYASLFILLYLPWLLFRTLIPIPDRRRGVRK